MSAGLSASIYKYQFPFIFGSSLLTAVMAFMNREYFLTKIRGQGAETFKSDPETARIFEEFKENMGEK